MLGTRRILLLDTPGFDDSAVENLEVLNDIAANLYTFALQRAEIETRGVIFLHDISETRFGGSQRKTLEILKALCGPNGMKNCIIGTTMWNPSGTPKFRNEEAREREFTRGHWRGILKTTRLYEDDSAAVVGVLNDLLVRPPVLLLVQEEMLVPPHSLEKTTVGKIAIPEGRAEAERLRREFEEYQRQSREDAEAQEEQFRREREEARRLFEEERIRMKEEARKRDEERQKREDEQRRQHEEQIRRMNAENRKRAEEDAKRRREEDDRRQEEQRREWDEYTRRQQVEFARKEEEQRMEFQEQQRRYEEQMERERQEERERADRARAEFSRAAEEPEQVPWWETLLNVIPNLISKWLRF